MNREVNMNREDYMNMAGDLDFELSVINNSGNENLSSDGFEIFGTADTPFLSIYCC